MAHELELITAFSNNITVPFKMFIREDEAGMLTEFETAFSAVLQKESEWELVSVKLEETQTYNFTAKLFYFALAVKPKVSALCVADTEHE